MNEEIRQMCESINQLPERLRLKAVTECICTAEAEHKLRWATCAFLHDLISKVDALSWSDRESYNHETRMNYEAIWLDSIIAMLSGLRDLKKSLSEK